MGLIHYQLWKDVCENNDQKAFEALFKLLYDRLINFSMMYVSIKEPAEEIVSDVFVQLWTKRKTIASVHSPETYLFVAVKNRSLNYLRQYSRYHVVSLEAGDSSLMSTTSDPGKEVEAREMLFKMDEAVASLPHQCRVVFRLLKEEGLRYKEVAQILGISPRTVETQLFRAMKKLDKVLKPYLQADNDIPRRTKKLRSVLFLSAFIFFQLL